jgi:hypothetical protein
LREAARRRDDHDFEAVVRALRDALTKAEQSLASSDGEASLTGSFTVTVRGKGQ